MKTIKPMRLGVLSRVYEIGTQPWLVITSIAFFPLDRPDVLLTEQQLWQTFMASARMPAPATDGSTPYFGEIVLDEGNPKAQGEVLVRGWAHPPDPPQPGCSVRVVVGPPERPLVDKTLVVSGDRRWDFLGMSMPEPFERMPLDWSTAFGGAGFADNPVGKGMGPAPGPDGKPVHPLPNVEYPKQRVKAQGDRPKPASFAPMDPTWQPRLSKLGTFDQRWLDTEYPGLPSDMSLESFNAAPRDQRIEGFFEGGEPFVLEHMHPTRPRIEGRLPALKARAFYLRRGETPEQLREVPMRLDTVQFLPHLERGILVFRGVARIDEDDGWDVSHVMLAAERPGEPRTMDAYREVFRTRIDPESGAEAALRDVDLLPPLAADDGDGGDAGVMARMVARDQLFEQNQDRRVARHHATMLEEMRAAGLDPADFGTPLVPPRSFVGAIPADPGRLAEVVATEEKRQEDERQAAERRREEAEQKARALCEKHGVDYDTLMESDAGGGPPRFSAEAELANLRAAVASASDVGVPLPGLAQRANDPAFEAELREQERQLKDLYRTGAHLMPAVAAPGEDEATMRGLRVRAAQDGKVSLAEVDLSGADLTGAPLQGADLASSFLERARLDGADLTGADLSGSVLARASLKGARLAGANLRGANLGEADLTDADLTGADLTGAVLFRAHLAGTRLDEARLTEVDAWEVTMHDVSLAGATVEKTTFLRARFERVVARSAKMADVTFIESDVPGLDLGDAVVDQLSFVSSRGRGCSFRGARLDRFSMLGESAFPAADFSGAHLPGASLRGTDLEGATFEGAVLEGTDLSECNARNAVFRRVIATEAVLVRTDLTDADLRDGKLVDVLAHKMRVAGATFEGANLYRADVAGARGDERTSFSGANLGAVRHPRRAT